MNEESTTGFANTSVEEALQRELESGDLVLASTRPILQHLLNNRDETLFSDEVIARIRGMVGHVARQMLFAWANARSERDQGVFAHDRQQELAGLLLEDVGFLGHAHTLALEAQTSEQLQRRSGIDAVLTPLVQELSASNQKQIAASAMRVMASQARFIQQQRRMELPLGELPGDLFHKALLLMRSHAGDCIHAEQAEAMLRTEHDESQSRLGQMTRLVMAMGRKATQALAIDHAGLALFATALAMASGQDRNLAVLSFGENQLVRLALSLRAAGLQRSAVEEQFLFIHPDKSLPEGLGQVSAERAAALLESAQTEILV